MVNYNFINIGVWNIQNIFRSINKDKFCKLDDPQGQKIIKQFEILCLQEIQCGPSEAERLSLTGYQLIPFHRKKSSNNRYFGGSLLIIKNEIRNSIKIIESHNADIIWVKLLKKHFGFERDVFICFAYVTPIDILRCRWLHQ